MGFADLLFSVAKVPTACPAGRRINIRSTNEICQWQASRWPVNQAQLPCPASRGAEGFRCLGGGSTDT